MISLKRNRSGMQILPWKSWLVVKQCKAKHLGDIFRKTNINVYKEGDKYLGRTVKTNKFCKCLCKIKNLIKGLANLVYYQRWKHFNPLSTLRTSSTLMCAFTAGFIHKITYAMWMVCNIFKHLQKLDNFIGKHFIPVIG